MEQWHANRSKQSLTGYAEACLTGEEGLLIDLHNHILPGLDDGAADLAESLAMGRQFFSEGVTTIAATPHLNPLNGVGTPASAVREGVRQLTAALAEDGIALAVFPGNEIFLTPDVPDLLRDGVAAPIADGPWVVVELPFNQRPPYLEDTLFRIEAAGFRPILAHPERYGFVQANVAILDDFVDRGLALQLTAPALLGEYSTSIRRAAEALLVRGSYALASSDRHHGGSGRSLSATRQRIIELRDEQTADLLLSRNPAQVISGADVALPPPERPASRPRWSHLFGRQ